MSTYPTAPLSDVIAGFDAGTSVNAEDRPAGPGEKGVLKVSAVGFGHFRPRENKAVLARELGRIGPEIARGDILISRANTHELVGAAAMVDSATANLHLSDKTWRVRLRSEYETTRRWLPHVLNAAFVRDELRRRATGTSGSMKNISQEAFLGIRVPLPSERERENIAQLLDALSARQQLTERLLVLKRRFRRGLAQQLLTGRRRFTGFAQSDERQNTPFGSLPADWRYVPVARVAREITGRTSQHSDARVMACTKHDGLVDSLNYFGRQVYSSDTSGYKVVTRNQFAFPSNHIEEGSIGLLTQYDEGLVSPIYVVLEADDQVVPAFLYAVFKTNTYRHIFSVSTNASVDRRGSLRWADFAKLRVPLPSREEQQRIVDALAALDTELLKLQRLQQLLTTQKRALLDRLLTGQLRLTNDDA